MTVSQFNRVATRGHQLAAFWLAVIAAMLSLTVVTPASASAPAPDQANARYEVRFMTEMIDHHFMAVQMATMCLDKAVHPELEALCQNIVTSQTQEIQMMQAWLSDWYGISYSPEMTKGDQQMMARMASMPPAEFEMEFLKMMIRHHWKAVVRASQCIERAYHPELVAMCEHIVLSQSAEIELMREWLCAWYGICNYGPKGSKGEDRLDN